MKKEDKEIFWRRFWAIFKRSYAKVTIVTLVIVFLLTSLMNFVLLSSANERETTALLALEREVDNNNANRAAGDIKIILSNDSTPEEVLLAIRDIKTIDDDFYLGFYTSEDLDILSIVNDGALVDQSQFSDSFKNTSQLILAINGTPILYLIVVLLVIYLLVLRETKNMFKEEKAEAEEDKIEDKESE